MDRYALLAVTLEWTYVENSIWSCRCALLAITDGVVVPVSRDVCLNTANAVRRGNTVRFPSILDRKDSLNGAGSHLGFRAKHQPRCYSNILFSCPKLTAYKKRAHLSIKTQSDIMWQQEQMSSCNILRQLWKTQSGRRLASVEDQK